jgi:hypothetical protein
MKVTVKIPSFQHKSIVYEYELSQSQFIKYQNITQGQKMDSPTVHKLLVSGCLTKQVKVYF